MTAFAGHQPCTFLLVEDDDFDVMLFESGLRCENAKRRLVRARDGREALALLRGDGEQPPLQRPFVIFLDLKMPTMDGHEFLAELRRDEALRDSVVFVLTSSRAKRDIRAAHDQLVAGYVVKSAEVDDQRALLRFAEQYADLVVLPDAA